MKSPHNSDDSAEGVARGAVFTVVGSLAARGSAIISAFLATSLIGIDGFGSYSFFLATNTLVSGVGLMGIQSVLTREVALQVRGGRLNSNASGILTVTTALGAMVSVMATIMVVAFPFTASLEELRKPILATLLPWSVSTIMNVNFTAILVGLGEYRASAKLQSFRGVLVALLTVVGCLSGDVQFAVLGACIAEVTVAAISRRIVNKFVIVEPAAGNSARLGATRALRLGLGSGSASLLIQASMWVLSAILIEQSEGLAENGLFSLALRVSLVITLAPQALVTVLLPKISRSRDGGSLRMGVWLPTGLAVGAALGVALIVSLVARLETAGLTDALSVVLVMCLVAVLSVLNSALGNRAVALKRIRIWVFSDYVLAATMLAVGLSIVSGLGAMGVTVSHGCAYLASVLTMAGGLALRPQSTSGPKGESTT